jgi:hypothetical protein
MLSYLEPEVKWEPPSTTLAQIMPNISILIVLQRLPDYSLGFVERIHLSIHRLDYDFCLYPLPESLRDDYGPDTLTLDNPERRIRARTQLS